MNEYEYEWVSQCTTLAKAFSKQVRARDGWRIIRKKVYTEEE